MKFETKTLGILGGGQLGRMSALAAARLGIKTHIYCPETDAPASQVAAMTFTGDYTDRPKLKAFAESVDVVTYEFENIPVETIRYIQKYRPVLPDDRLLEVSQHRLTEKKFLNDIGIETARWARVTSAAEIDEAVNAMGGSDFIIKTARFGYDGKGQARFGNRDNSKATWKKLKCSEAIIEEVIDFSCEVSVIIARDKLAQIALYGPVLNEHKNHILHKSTAPAPLPEHMVKDACRMAELLAEAVDLVGVLALEMFVTKDGRLLANEIAPRTHNSGHWTIDACTVSQFEQHVRAVCGMPVGAPGRHSDAVMYNLLGSDVRKLGKWIEMPYACIHLYGKDDVKEGRKMGHVTVLKPPAGTAIED